MSFEKILTDKLSELKDDLLKAHRDVVIVPDQVDPDQFIRSQCNGSQDSEQGHFVQNSSLTNEPCKAHRIVVIAEDPSDPEQQVPGNSLRLSDSGQPGQGNSLRLSDSGQPGRGNSLRLSDSGQPGHAKLLGIQDPGQGNLAHSSSLRSDTYAQIIQTSSMRSDGSMDGLVAVFSDVPSESSVDGGRRFMLEERKRSVYKEMESALKAFPQPQAVDAFEPLQGRAAPIAGSAISPSRFELQGSAPMTGAWEGAPPPKGPHPVPIEHVAPAIPTTAELGSACSSTLGRPRTSRSVGFHRQQSPKSQTGPTTIRSSFKGVMSMIAEPRGSQMLQAKQVATSSRKRSIAQGRRRSSFSQVYRNLVDRRKTQVQEVAFQQTISSSSQTLTSHLKGKKMHAAVGGQAFVNNGFSKTLSTSSNHDPNGDFKSSINSVPASRRTSLTEAYRVVPAEPMAEALPEHEPLRATRWGQQDHGFDTWSVWQEEAKQSAKQSGKLARQNKSFAQDDSDSESSEDMLVANYKKDRDASFIVKHLMMQPNSGKRTMWDLLGFLFVGWDFVVVPLQFFELETTPFLYFVRWCTFLFWAIDFPLSFFKGYCRPEGTIEMRPLFVALHYAMTWMLFDLCLIVADAIEIFVDGFDHGKVARVGKTLKVFRMVRIARLLRVVRVIRIPDIFQAVSYYFERFSILLGILRIIGFLLMCMHIIACIWYGIGVDEGVANGDNWVTYHNIAGRKLSYRYTTSLHWSLTQFTGSMEIYPTNLYERSFAIVTLLLGFLVASYMVSNITSSMTRLQIVTARRSTQVSQLKKYLADNGISTKVALRVQRNALYALSQEEKNTAEDSVELLALVSEPLRVELHYEINGPILKMHPIFYALDKKPDVLRRMCHTTLHRLSLSRGDVLFNVGEMPTVPLMYFVLCGKLHYEPTSLEEDDEPIGVQLGSWFCEAVLWAPWEHCGLMQAKTHCSLLGIYAEKFQQIAKKTQARIYAQAFVKKLNAIDGYLLTDMDNFDVEELAIETFGREVFPNAGDSVPAKVSTSISKRTSQESARSLGSEVYVNSQNSVLSSASKRHSAFSYEGGKSYDVEKSDFAEPAICTGASAKSVF